jgi:shikimate kinase
MPDTGCQYDLNAYIKMNIYLIGYRATGKTSVGRSLASILQWSFIDTDSEVAGRVGMSIAEFVHQNGWKAFRETERSVMKRVCTLEEYVVATGGGVVLEPRNVTRMRSSGYLIWLKALPETIRTRLSYDRQSEHTRPALTSQGLIEEIEAMLKKRHSHYHGAMDFCIDTDQLSIDDICNTVVTQLAEKGKL